MIGENLMSKNLVCLKVLIVIDLKSRLMIIIFSFILVICIFLYTSFYKIFFRFSFLHNFVYDSLFKIAVVQSTIVFTLEYKLYYFFIIIQFFLAYLTKLKKLGSGENEQNSTELEKVEKR